ncbi:MAG: GMP synthase subunit A [Methanoregula sp.]|jgi:GMP synthase (glutamine-hydrolysing)|uniref:GMP synthase subunit A n=1 Tax=Methanoregula sp. TaxID=2052170 RepID=UPI0025D53D06|nr:GMP synthase subunit A [Methanoregula sp.]MCK9631312.1 GMP synthase subunit A [Methanoregula sp.]
MLPIYVVNNFGQFNHLIHRALRDLDIDAVLVPNTTPPEKISNGCRGIILGGGPSIERAGNCSQYLDLGLPVLGICLGLHIIAKRFGGSVQTGQSGGYGPVDIEICETDEILEGYPEKMSVWASHADEVAQVPDGFTLLARSLICNNEAIAFPDKNIYGLQWHPEVSHTFEGKRIFENFNRIILDNP